MAFQKFRRFLGLTCLLAGSAHARDWTAADLVQKVAITCEITSRVGGDTFPLARSVFMGSSPLTVAAVEVRASVDERHFIGRLLHRDGAVLISLEEEGVGLIDELMHGTYYVNEDLWFSPTLAPGRGITFYCGYRGERGRDLSLVYSLAMELNTLVQGLADVKAGVNASVPLSATEACYRLGVTVLRGQRLAERSLGPGPGPRASTALTALRNALSGEVSGTCRGAPSAEDFRAMLARVDEPVAQARTALSPDAP